MVSGSILLENLVRLGIRGRSGQRTEERTERIRLVVHASSHGKRCLTHFHKVLPCKVWPCCVVSWVMWPFGATRGVALPRYATPARARRPARARQERPQSVPIEACPSDLNSGFVAGGVEVKPGLR